MGPSFYGDGRDQCVLIPTTAWMKPGKVQAHDSNIEHKTEITNRNLVVINEVLKATR